jgi:HEAT repeat protein
MAYASALGKLRVPEAVAPLLDVLHGATDRISRLELSLALARIIGDEGPFIKLVRQVRTEIGTASAQALEGLTRRLEKDEPEGTRLPALARDCTNAFARNNLGEGAALLKDLIETVRPDHASEPGGQVLQECARRLGQIGAEREEYVLLALYALNVE